MEPLIRSYRKIYRIRFRDYRNILVVANNIDEAQRKIEEWDRVQSKEFDNKIVSIDEYSIPGETVIV